jgi:uncharacterized heparinase superfamily protein
MTLLGRDEVELLNVRKSLQWPGGWNDPTAERLWLYNLHYQDGLLNPHTPDDLKTFFVRQWIEDNGIGNGCGWEPYPISVRITNWIKWLLTGGVPPSGVDVNRSLATQTRYLLPRLEFHLLGNHLLTNAVALTFAGLYFDGPEAAHWLATGQRLLERELKEQFLDDGGHFELSTTYHAQLTEALLDVLQMFRVADRPYPREVVGVATRGLNWLMTMTRPDGRPPLFNDAAYGTSRTSKELLEYGRRLGCEVAVSDPRTLVYLQSSGYFRYRSERLCVLGDIGQIGPDYIPGHAHCDMLSFELCVDERPTIVDTGTSTYEIGARRSFERSTAAHNTVQLGALEQSEMWGSFRVGRRARVRDVRTGPDFVEASHDGFVQSLGSVHRRRFAFRRDTLTITDELLSPLQAFARFHFSPETTVELTDHGVTAGPLRITFDGALNVEISRYRYAESFNVTRDAPAVTITFRNALISTLTP